MYLNNSIKVNIIQGFFFKSVQIPVLCDIRWHLLHLQVHLRMRMLQSRFFFYQRNGKNMTEIILGERKKKKKNYAYKKYLMVYKTTGWILMLIKKAKKLSLNGNALLFTKVPIRPTKTRGWCVSICLWFSFFFFFFLYLLECAHILCKYCCSIFLSYKLAVTLSATVSLCDGLLLVHQIGKLKGIKRKMHNLLCCIINTFYQGQCNVEKLSQCVLFA